MRLVLSGHDHMGGYAQHEHVHFVTIEAMLEGRQWATLLVSTSAVFLHRWLTYFKHDSMLCIKCASCECLSGFSVTDPLAAGGLSQTALSSNVLLNGNRDCDDALVVHLRLAFCLDLCSWMRNETCIWRTSCLCCML